MEQNRKERFHKHKPKNEHNMKNRNLIFPLLAFLIPLTVRFIPELLMGPFATGFDTIGYYTPNTILWLNHGVNFWTFISEAPLMYIFLMGAVSVGAPIVLLFKVLSPLLLGLLGLTVYFYANKTISWSQRKSLLAAGFATIYFVALRISWDMLRTEIGLIFLFISLILLAKKPTLKNTTLLAIAMLLTVFSHQLIAVIMFSIILATILQATRKKTLGTIKHLFTCSAPAVCLFIVIIYSYSAVGNPILRSFPNQISGGDAALLGFSSQADLILNTLAFVVVCFLPLVPLLFFGAKRFKNNFHMNVWILWIFLALLLAFISPSTFAVYPYRWVLLLTYPLAFFAAEGFCAVKNRYRLVLVVILAVFSLSFAVLPNSDSNAYYTLYPNYIPKSMLQNTVQLSDCQDTINALQWAKSNMTADSQLLVHDVFYGWALLNFDNTRLINYDFDYPDAAAAELINDGVQSAYLIWWINGSGWYGQPIVSGNFSQVYCSGNVAIYLYKVQNS
ncbi:MAG: hypothetical protein NWF01_12110 [Candidatus Bathyarchaeota archaeon]|nr:hypothetical protein [Candidatus Bathyarchaeota archaeon]